MRQIEKFIYPVLFVLIFLVFWFSRSENSLNIVNLLLFLGVMFFLLYHGIGTIKAYGAKSVHGKALMFLVAGFALSIIWTVVYDFTKDMVLIDAMKLSVSDILGIITYTLVYIGVIKEIKQGKISWTGGKIVTTSFAIIALVSFIAYYGLYKPALKIDPAFMANDTSSVVITLINLSLVAFSVLIYMLVKEYEEGEIATAWLLILIGFFIRMLGDVAVVSFYEGFMSGQWPYRNIGLLWHVSIALYGYGFYKMRVVVDDINQSLINKKI